MRDESHSTAPPSFARPTGLPPSMGKCSSVLKTLVPDADQPAVKVPHRKPRTTTRQLRLSLLTVVAPERPPCFLNHAEWLGFLAAADEAAVTARVTPVVLIESGRARINPRTRFCADCTDEYRLQHQRAGTCRPKWLAEQPQTKTMQHTTPTSPQDYTPADGVESEGGSHD